MPNLFQRAIGRFARATGSLPHLSGPTGRPDYSAADMEILKRVRPFTMTSDERLIGMIDAVRYIARSGIAGAIVECGVWRGGSAMSAALALREIGDVGRDFYLYDTFEGMTAPSEVDTRYDGISASEQFRSAVAAEGSWCRAGLDDVRSNMASTGYPAERIHYVQGKVEETIPATCPDAIALLRLDTDWYESTRHEMIHLFPRLSHGGVLISDDYGYWDGHRKAIDEYLAKSPLLLARLDSTGRIAVKIN